MLRPPIRPTAATRLLVIVAGLLSLCIPSAAGGAVSPLPASDYTVRPMCAAPALGHAGCLALALAPRTASARAHTHPLGITRSGPARQLTPAEGGYGLRPEDLRGAYFPLPGEHPRAPESEPQTIAIVDVFHDPHARADLNRYSREFALPELAVCGLAASNCFAQVNQTGQTTSPPFPSSESARREELGVCESATVSKETAEAACARVMEADGWALEISTDMEVAHAVCQNCKILLVEANSSEYKDLEMAEETAARLGASEISNSWGGPEPVSDSPAFNHPRTVVTASSGDYGYLNWTSAAGNETYNSGADYPASSPHVLAVGGTRLSLKQGAWESEAVWNGAGQARGAAGSGCSLRFGAQAWQREVPDWSAVGCESRRAVADVSAEADPYPGVAVYDSGPYLREEGGKRVNRPLEWLPIGGTSVSSPIIAAMFALAGGAHNVEYPAATLYSHLETELLHAVAAGGNGECGGLYSSGCAGSINPLSARFAFDCGEGALICNAAAGCQGLFYSGPAGLGTPRGIGAFKAEVHPSKNARECEAPSKSGAPSSKEGPAAPQAPSGGTGRATGGPAGAGAGGPPSSASSKRAPTLSGASLTRTAIKALHRARARGVRPSVFQVGFAFTLSAAAPVHVTLAKRVGTGRRARWQRLPYSLTVLAAAGRNGRRLRGHDALSPGRYRLTLTPLHGAAQSIVFQLR